MAKPAPATAAPAPAPSKASAETFDTAVAGALAGKAPPNADRSPMHTAAATDNNEPAHDPAHETPRVRTRQRQQTIQSPFDIPKDEIPEGSSYEWKRYSVSGNTADHDAFYLASMRRQGWEPVDPRRHPNWVPPGYDKPNIIRDGLILMERPIELTNDARQEMKSLAKTQVKEAEQRLGLSPKVNGTDTMTRDHEGVRPRVVKELGRMVAIEE